MEQRAQQSTALLDAITGSPDLLATFVEGLPAPVAILDADMRYLGASRRWITDFAPTGPDFLGRSHYELFPEILQMPRWLAVHQRCLAGATESGQADPFPRQDGRIDYTNWEIRPWRRQDGAVGGLIMFCEVITERIALERTTRELTEASETNARLYEQTAELGRQRADFFASVSHELRTPLTLILAPLEKLLADPALAEPWREQLEVIGRNAQSLLTHVNDLLDAAKLDADKVVATYEDVDLRALLEATVTHFDAIARERHLALSLDVTPPVCAAEVDPAMIRRVFMNLLANAVRFTPAGGCVRCALRTTPASGGLPRGEAVLEVADSGPGIEPALRDAIFERFRQVAGDGTHRFGGTGLGLAIARDLVVLHGGRIEAGVAPEGGALFTIRLPLLAPPGVPVAARSASRDSAAPIASVPPAAAVEPATLGPATPAPAEGPLVLVVEDSADMRALLARELTKAGLRVATARDGQEGLELARDLTPALVLSDLMMPRLDGLALLGALRSDPRLATVPFILLTARSDEPSTLQGLAGGADDYITKPFSLRELVARVRSHLTLAAARREAALREEEAARLREAVAARDEFLSVASHELRTPLASMQLNLQLIDRLLAGRDEELHKRLVTATRGCRHLATLVDRLLDVGRAATGRLDLHLRELDLHDLITDLAGRLQAELAAAGCELALDLDGPAPGRWDRTRLEQILGNLVANAMKFGAGKPIAIGCRTDEAGVRVTVRDHGPGVAPEHQARIFGRFEQAHAPLEYGGLGLGLWIASELARAHHGTLRVESQPGHGATFILTLPRTPEAAGPDCS